MLQAKEGPTLGAKIYTNV